MAERIEDPDRRQALRRACAALKVFPLHGVAVLPGTPTPLHVFEPRYRALVRDALRGDRMLAVPNLYSAEGLRDLYPRVRLGEELRSDCAYRTFQAELAPDRLPRGGADELAPGMESLRQLVLELSTRLPPESGAPELAEAVAQLKDTSAAVDLVAAAAISEPEARQAVLEELDVARRLERVVSEVASVVLLLSRGRNARA